MSGNGGQILIHRISDTFDSSNLKHKIEVVKLLMYSKLVIPQLFFNWLELLSEKIFSRVFTLNVALQGLSSLGFVSSRVCLLQGLSSLGFVALQGLSPSSVCRTLGFVLSMVCPLQGLSHSRVCPLQGPASLGFVSLGFVLSWVRLSRVCRSTEIYMCCSLYFLFQTLQSIYFMDT